jgi:hypothetical protein
VEETLRVEYFSMNKDSSLTENITSCWPPSTSKLGRNAGDFLSKEEASTRSFRSVGFSKEREGEACCRAASDSSNRKMDSPTIGIHDMLSVCVVMCLSERVFSINNAAFANIEP